LGDRPVPRGRRLALTSPGAPGWGSSPPASSSSSSTSQGLILVPVSIALFLVLSPQPMKRRALSIFSLNNYGNTLRIEYLQAGWRIIRKYPSPRHGPDTVDMVFQNPEYGLSEVGRQNVTFT